MTEITDIEFTQILEMNGFSESQIRFVLDEIFSIMKDGHGYDFHFLTNLGFNAWQIRFLIKLFDVK